MFPTGSTRGSWAAGAPTSYWHISWNKFLVICLTLWAEMFFLLLAEQFKKLLELGKELQSLIIY
jgi:hypothetical protein